MLTTHTFTSSSQQSDDVQPVGRPLQQQQCQRLVSQPCSRLLSLSAAGVTHQHGPIGEPCKGSGWPPFVVSTSSYRSNSIASVTTAENLEVLINTIRSDRCRLLKHVPMASRVLAADKPKSVGSRISVKSNDTLVWEDLLRFSYACSAVPGGRAVKRHYQSLTSKVNTQLNTHPTFFKRPLSFQQQRSRKVAASDDKMALHDDKTLSALRLKHPQRRVFSCVTASSLQNNNNLNTSCSLPPPLVVQDSDIIDAIKSFPASWICRGS